MFNIRYIIFKYFKIADLGSSKIYTELHNSCNYGTPLYSAPEILLEK